jgi:hypothetical protein
MTARASVQALVDATTALLAASAGEDWLSVERHIRQRDEALVLLARGLTRVPLDPTERELLRRAAQTNAEAMRLVAAQQARLGRELAELRQARAQQPSRPHGARPLVKA